MLKMDSKDYDSREVGKLEPHISLAKEVEKHQPWKPNQQFRAVTESTIQDKFEHNRQAILDSLYPSHPQLFKLVCELRLDEEFAVCQIRAKNAEKLLKKVEKSEDFIKQFLNYLEKDEEHLGHKYIVSLLRGEHFGDEIEIEESRKILERIRDKMSIVVKELHVNDLLPFLRKCDLVTDNDVEELQNILTTTQNKASRLLTILRTKGPIAHYIFLHKCLADKEANNYHVYTQLAARKRKLTAHNSIYAPSIKVQVHRKCDLSVPPTTVLWRQPRPLQLPGGITDEHYMEKISRVRQNCSNAEHFLQAEMDSPANSLDARTAFCLEKCYFYVKDIEETKRIVSEARKLNLDGSNSQVLESRCELMLGRCYTKCKNYDQAKKCLDSANTTLSTFEPGEDTILANYFIANNLSAQNEIRCHTLPLPLDQIEKKMIAIFLQRCMCICRSKKAMGWISLSIAKFV